MFHLRPVTKDVRRKKYEWEYSLQPGVLLCLFIYFFIMITLLLHGLWPISTLLSASSIIANVFVNVIVFILSFRSTIYILFVKAAYNIVNFTQHTKQTRGGLCRRDVKGLG